MVKSKPLYNRGSAFVVTLLFSLIFSSYQVIYDSEMNIFYKINDDLKSFINLEMESADFSKKYPDKAHVLLVYYVNLFTPVYRKVMQDGTEDE